MFEVLRSPDFAIFNVSGALMSGMTSGYSRNTYLGVHKNKRSVAECVLFYTVVTRGGPSHGAQRLALMAC